MNITGQILVCNGEINGNTINVKKKPGVISEDTLKRVTEELKDKLLYIEGTEESRYDNSDDDRAGCYTSRHPFGYYCEIDPQNNSKHLLQIDGEIKGIVFFVTKGYYDVDYHPFLFDGSIQSGVTLGYSASHSSNYIYIEKATLVKRGENGAPENGRKISFQQSKTSTSL